ncbi:MAG TPA: hypothetical protein PKC74_01040 [Turneriella sp.]|nr:hypothetical protein [Turneriella sp.]
MPAGTITDLIVRPARCIVLSFFCIGSIFAQRSGLTPQTDNAIEFEVARLAEHLTSEGFSCADRVLAGQAESIETQLTTEPMMAYILAVVTGRGGSAVPVQSFTVVNQGNKSFEIPFENTRFGGHAAIAVRLPGDKILKVRLTQKATYRLLICKIETSVYRMKQFKPALASDGKL